MFSGLLAGAILAPPLVPLCGTRLSPPADDIRTEQRKDALAQYGAAIWQARRDRLLSAAKQLEAVARQDPDATAPLKELVRIYAQIGREPEAIRIGRKVIAKDPTDADTAHILARLLFDAGEVKEAVTVAKLAAESPNLADRPDKALAIYRDLATLCDAAGDPVAAEGALRKAVRFLTENRKAVLLSGLYTPQEIDTELADLHERLGRVLVKQLKFEQSATAFTMAHDLYADPDRANDPQAAARLDWNLSSVYAAKGDAARALNHLERFLKLKPQATEPYERLAALMRQAGRGDQVVVALRWYADRDPKNLSLRAVLAVELARDPATRADADFTKLSEATNDRAVLRVVVRSHIETNQPRLILDELDAAYKAVANEKLATIQRTFAAEKARTIGDILKAEPEWASAVFRAAAEDLRTGTRRTHQTWHLLGLLAARHRKLEFAVLQFRQAVRGAPADTELDAYLGLINTLRRLRRPADIAAACRDGLQNARWTPPVFFNLHLSLALAELGDADAALAAVDKAILQAGDIVRLDARVRKVWVLHTLGRDDEAIAFAKKLLDEFHDPADRIRIRYALASAYYGVKKYAEWEAELRAILDFDPDHAAACNDLGYHLADQGRNFDEAERLLRHAIAVDRAERKRTGDPEPESAAYLDSLGWVLFRQGKLSEARELIERAAALPDGAVSGEIWDHLGDVCFRLDDKPAAKDAWDKALTAYSTDARAKRDGRPDEVRRKLKRIP